MEITSLRGIPTQVFRRPAPLAATAASLPATVLLIPGNPGLAQLYRPLAARLFEQGAGQWSVGVAAHAGHAPGHPHPSDPKGWFSLADQLAHHRTFLHTFPEVQAGGQVHVVGHSIGALLGLQLYHDLPAEQRGRLVLLMPTLEAMAETPNGRRLRPLFTPAGQRAAAGVLLGLRGLPGPLKGLLATRLYLRQAPSGDRDDLRAGLLTLDVAGLRNVLRLAGEELRTVTTLPHDLLAVHAARTAAGFVAGDGWNLPGAASRLPSKATVWQAPEGTRHAFLFGDQVEPVAAWVAGVLRD